MRVHDDTGTKPAIATDTQRPSSVNPAATTVANPGLETHSTQAEQRSAKPEES
jgi:hypothetical protein